MKFRLEKQNAKSHKTLSVSLYRDAHGRDGAMVSLSVDGSPQAMVLTASEVEDLHDTLGVILDDLDRAK